MKQPKKPTRANKELMAKNNLVPDNWAVVSENKTELVVINKKSGKIRKLDKQEVQMKPILFNTEMVRAILEGRKTVTRRVVKTQHKNACGFYVTTRKSDGAFMGVYDYDENEKMFESSQTPPYWVNDVLYVRETWCDDRQFTHDDTAGIYFYKANEPDELDKILKVKWRPSIHMPREAARIFLRVKSVRVERLQDMTKEDMLKEGIIDHFKDCKATFSCDLCIDESNVEDEFFHLWNSTIKKDQLKTYGWYANPYVWVIEFERISKEEADNE